ncbi:MAG: isochorismatase family protein [Rhizobiales bacterium]|nr:isochorismatase family protein [Hyphomicrobiales bacterium]
MSENIETVHLAIDIQQSFEHKPDWDLVEFRKFEQHELALIAGLQDLAIPTIQIFHIEPNGIFGKKSGYTIAMDFMPKNLNGIFEKHIHNALTDSGLHEWLKQHNVRNIIISGIRTEQCCETTTRVASDFGYHVDYVTQATLTFPMTHQQSGKVFSTDDIKTKTELVLQDRFADIHTVDSLLAKYKGM